MLINLQGCVKTVTETRVEYVMPNIPSSVTSPCDPIKHDIPINTNGDLIMAYISIQSAYVVCSSKVSAIANILKSYNTIYTEESVNYSE